MSLREYAAETAAKEAEESGGWTCPHCGCQDLRDAGGTRVESTRAPKRETVLRRRRICRHCKRGTLTTAEVVIPPGHKAIVVPEEP
jgi:transcriptional regulator NrdR family protein